MSSFWAIGDASEGLNKLADDLDTGAWARRNAHLLNLVACDFGCRLVTAK